MGGKSSTSTQQVTVPPAVLAQYASVNARADQTANTPFQQYSTDPNAFVAPVNAQENSGIAGINAAANQAQPFYTQAAQTLGNAQAAAQPYYGAAGSDISGAQSVGTGLAGASLGSLNSATAAGAGLNNAANQNYGSAYQAAQPYNIGATGYALAGGQAVNADPITGQTINQYMSPYLQDVLGSESALLNQNNQQQQMGQLGNAITSGAFGGDRAGIGAANLEQQQNLANANIYSGILNTGYNNALATAQQQQGVNLGAGQANRAAAQATGASLADIGQQTYAQGTGLASNQAALGQQEYAQGANTAAQQAALGQQQFGQGITAANTQAGLGQDVYGTGAATSAAQSNLGTAAQTASEQGAQAQLAAGQLQQQTTQAGDTALYNQFLQQQSYPFQVDQFLANIAEGTGALSGSTTTTTQPGSLFSDERLKEDIEPIGKTFDGQNIVKFRYKGDKKTQIGLIAQDVEKKHPNAVGLAGGYRTVDYDKATDDAARRGHFAGGGLARAAFAYGGYPMLPGMYPGDMQAILQSQSQMYAPYGQQSGIYGGAGGSGPRGGSSYVPQASLPVSHLAVANTNLPPRQTLLQTADQAAKIADNPLIAKGLSAASNWLQGSGGEDPAAVNDPATLEGINDLWNGNARGGAIRKRRAVGGGGLAGADLPYTDPNDGALNIPDTTPTATLATAKGAPSGGSGSTMGDLGDIASIASTAAKFLPMILAMKSGGSVERRGYDDGGSADDTAAQAINPWDWAHPAITNAIGSALEMTPGLNGIGSTILSSSPGNAARGNDAVAAGLAGMADQGPSAQSLGEITGSARSGKPLTPDDIIARAYAQAGDPSGPTMMQGRAPIPTATASNPAPIHVGSTSANVSPTDVYNQAVALNTPGGMDAAPSSFAPVTADSLANVNADVAANKPLSPDDIIAKDYASTSLRAPIPAGGLASAPTGGLLPQVGLGKGPQGGSAVDPIQSLPAPQGTAAAPSGAPGGGILGAIGQGVGAAEHGLHDVLSKVPGLLSDPHTLIPILTGLAAWTGAPTRNPLTALAQGLGAGAQSYGNIQEKLANVGQVQAQTGQVNAQRTAQALANSKALQQAALMGRIKLDPSGPLLDSATGLRYSNVQAAPGAPAGAPASAAAGTSPGPAVASGTPAATSYKYLGPNAASALSSATQQYVNDGPMGNNANPARLAQSTSMAGDIYAAGADAKTTLTNLNEQAAAVFSPDRKGALTQGALAPVLEPAIAKWNDLVQAAGLPQAQITGLGDTQIAEKLQIGGAAAAASGAGQMSLGALNDFSRLQPGPNLDPKAAANLLAQNAMLATKASDRRNALMEANQSASAGGFSGGALGVETQPIMEAVDRDNTPQMYSNMRDTLAALYQSPTYQTIRAGLSASPDSPQYKSTVATLDALGDQKGIPHFSRVLTGE